MRYNIRLASAHSDIVDDADGDGAVSWRLCNTRQHHTVRQRQRLMCMMFVGCSDFRQTTVCYTRLRDRDMQKHSHITARSVLTSQICVCVCVGLQLTDVFSCDTTPTTTTTTRFQLNLNLLERRRRLLLACFKSCVCVCAANVKSLIPTPSAPHLAEHTHTIGMRHVGIVVCATLRRNGATRYGL